MSNPFYKNVVFPGMAKKEEKKLDNKEDLSYTKETTENPVKDFNPDYKAYSIVRVGNKKYQLVSIDFDSKTGMAAGTTVVKEYDSEARALKELQTGLAEAARKFRKQEF